MGETYLTAGSQYRPCMLGTSGQSRAIVSKSTLLRELPINHSINHATFVIPLSKAVTLHRKRQDTMGPINWEIRQGSGVQYPQFTYYRVTLFTEVSLAIDVFS